MKTKTIKKGNNIQNEKTKSNKSFKANYKNNEKFELATKIKYDGQINTNKDNKEIYLQL